MKCFGPASASETRPPCSISGGADRQPRERRVDVGDVLAGDDEVVAGQPAREIGDGILEGQRVGRGVDIDAERRQLRVGLLGHPLLAEAGQDVDPVAAPVEVAGQQPDLGLLAADHQPGEDEEDADRPVVSGVIARRRSAGSRAARPAAGEGSRRPRRSGTTWVMRCRRIASPSARSSADGLGRQPAAVPEGAIAARHPANLGTADGKAVVVERLAQPGAVEPTLVEGKVDHRALRPQRLQRQVQALGAGAGLEHQVGAASVRPVPAPLGLGPGLVLGQRREAEPASDLAPPVRRLGDQHLGAGAPGEKRGHEADGAAAPDHHRPTGDPGPQRGAGGAERFGIGVQQAVGADRPHLGHEDAEDGIEIRGQRHDELVAWIGGVSGLVAEGGGDGIARGEARRRRGDDAGDLHVAHERHRVARRRLAIREDAALVVPAGVQVRVGALEEGELGPGREAGIEKVEPDLARPRRPLAVLGVERLARALDAQRADGALGVRRHGHPRQRRGETSAAVRPAAPPSATGAPVRTDSATASATRWVCNASA